MKESPILQVQALMTEFKTERGIVNAVNKVSFDVGRGQTLGIVGESGSGKSVTNLSILRLIEYPPGRITGGKVLFHGKDLLDATEQEMLGIRGKHISMIFQDPLTSLNPVIKIWKQIAEALMLHQGMKKKEAKKQAIELLRIIGIPDPQMRAECYPHQFSGGMRQRVMIAMALACNPSLIIADEPTTALDVTIQAQILDLLRDIKHKLNGSILLITHDLGVIAEMADYVVVMYAGRVVEKGNVMEIFENPCHPYTMGLMKSKPVVNKDIDRLYNIPGNVPNPINMPNYCYFKDRCEMCIEECSGEYPKMVQVSPTHFVSCYRYKEV